MNTDVAGRVRNVQLPTSKPLLPLFEAITNSIHAIEDARAKGGRIDIEVLRDPASLFADSDRSHAEIAGFTVKDNGIGFDDRNFDAFSTADTTYKASRGGKGIGRFMWLAAFEHAEVESVFRSNGQTQCRRFAFWPRGTGIENSSCTTVPDADQMTVVRLVGFKDKYKVQCPKRLHTIATFIVEEFLEYFISPTPPVIVLRDVPSGDAIPLDQFFEEEMASKIARQEFLIKDRTFEVLHVRLYSRHVNEHRLYFCAHGRAVTSEKLLGRIPNLIRHLRDDSGNDFIYAAYVNSAFLDAAVSSDRTAFNLPENAAERTSKLRKSALHSTLATLALQPRAADERDSVRRR